MRVLTISGAILFSAAMAIGAAPAATVTFEDLPAGQCGFINSPFSSGGFQFSYTRPEDVACVNVGGPLTPADNSYRFSSNGTQTLGFQDIFANASPLTMSGLNFNLISVDLAKFLKAGDFAETANAEHITIVGEHPDSTLTSYTVTLPPSDGPDGVLQDFATFTLTGSFTNLIQVSFFSPDGASPFNERIYLMDNIVTTPYVAPVPEPASLALYGIGLLGFGLRHRHRRDRRRI